MVRLLAFLVFAAFTLPAVAADAPQTGDVAIQGFAASEEARFTLITTGGYVGVTVGGNWPVLAMQAQPPATAAVFQIPDAADAGTGDSTNLIVSLLQPGSDKANSILAGAEKYYVATAAAEGRYKDWTLHTMHAHQGATAYVIIDAQRTVADVICRVRIAWPQLAAHDGGYDAKMAALFDTVLDSIQGQTGPYQTHAGEVVRRPTY